MLYYVRDESCLAVSHLLGILPCQSLVTLPEHFDEDDNKHDNIADEDNGHRYNECPQPGAFYKIFALWNCQPAAMKRKEMISED